MPRSQPDPRIFAAGRVAASVDRERALAHLSHRRGVLLWGLATGWSVRPDYMEHPATGEEAEAWLWTSPEGEMYRILGKHHKVPTVPQDVYDQIARAYNYEEAEADDEPRQATG